MSGMNALLQQGGTAMTLAAQGAISCRKPWIPSRPGARVNEGKKIDDDKAAAAKQEAANEKHPQRRFRSAQWRFRAPVAPVQADPARWKRCARGRKIDHPIAGSSQASARKPSWARNTGQSDSAPTRRQARSLSLLVSVLPRNRNRSPILDLSGRLDTDGGPYAIEIPNGDWKIQVQGGVGSLAARPTSGARAALVGDLIVSSVPGPARWDAAPGIQSPACRPDGWTTGSTTRDAQQHQHSAHEQRHPAGRQRGSGSRSDLRLQLSGLLMVRRQFQLLGLDETTLDALTETFQISWLLALPG